jgi:4-amino-4-deoxy-L-arabinose transferase-like glycosyltransferase
MALGSFLESGAARARGVPSRHGGVAVVVALAVVLALGFGLRLEAALNPNENRGASSIVAYQGNDSLAYARIAEALYKTGRYGTPEMRHPTDWSPGAPLFYAGVYYLTGGVHEDLARVAVAVLGVLMILFVYLIGRRLGGPIVGVVGAALAAIYPTFIDNNEQFVSEPIAAFTLAATVLGILWARDPGRPQTGKPQTGKPQTGRPVWAWIVPGLFLGATALTRPEYLIFVAILGLLVLAVVARDRGIRLGIASAALFAAAFALVLAPWTVRNLVVMDRFVPVTTGGGKALFVATYLPGKGRQLPTKRKLIERFTGNKNVTDREVANTQMSDLLDRVAKKYPRLERDAALAKIGRENFRKYVRERPFAYGRMVATKMWNVWRRGSGPTMRGGGWIAFHYALLALGLLGLGVLAWRRRWEALVIGLLIASITVLGGLLLAVPRRNVPLMPLVFALAATGGAWLALTVGGRLAERRRPDATRPRINKGAGQPAG